MSGTAVFDHTYTTCPKDPPAGYGKFTSYDPLVLSGDLEGCWYTKIEQAWDLGPPTGLYFEIGREVFKGSIGDGREGTFSTVYTFESQWDPDAATGTEIWGHCEHPIVPGTGKAGLRGIAGTSGSSTSSPTAATRTAASSASGEVDGPQRFRREYSGGVRGLLDVGGDVAVGSQAGQTLFDDVRGDAGGDRLGRRHDRRLRRVDQARCRGGRR